MVLIVMVRGEGRNVITYKRNITITDSSNYTASYSNNTAKLSSNCDNNRFSLFNIVFRGSWSARQRDMILQARCVWDDVIVSRKSSDTRIVDIVIDGVNIDGRGGILGQAGPDSIFKSGSWIYTGGGGMELDVADMMAMSELQFISLVVHEMGHILGIGTLWKENGLVSSYKFIGTNAVAMFAKEYDVVTDYVQIEEDGSLGTRGSHWDETGNRISSSTLRDRYGRVLQYTVMTGWLEYTNHLASFTGASMIDMGYNVGEFCANDSDCSNNNCVKSFITVCGGDGRRNWDDQPAPDPTSNPEQPLPDDKKSIPGTIIAIIVICSIMFLICVVYFMKFRRTLDNANGQQYPGQAAHFPPGYGQYHDIEPLPNNVGEPFYEVDIENVDGWYTYHDPETGEILWFNSPSSVV